MTALEQLAEFLNVGTFQDDQGFQTLESRAVSTLILSSYLKNSNACRDCFGQAQFVPQFVEGALPLFFPVNAVQWLGTFACPPALADSIKPFTHLIVRIQGSV